VAAPTAGLHFTPELIVDFQARGVEFALTTLHVGLDTFRPVQEENAREHEMHSEYAELSPAAAAAINCARAEGRRIIAVGTTTVRVLESASALAEGKLSCEDGGSRQLLGATGPSTACCLWPAGLTSSSILAIGFGQ